jgi:hypothetical protein
MVSVFKKLVASPENMYSENLNCFRVGMQFYIVLHNLTKYSNFSIFTIEDLKSQIVDSLVKV